LAKRGASAMAKSETRVASNAAAFSRNVHRATYARSPSRLVLAAVFALGAGAVLGDDRDASTFTDPSVVVRWSQLANDHAFALGTVATDPFPSARGWTMMYLAMHDALNAIVPKYSQYAFFGRDASADRIAAAAQAAHDVLNHVYPTRHVENGAELAYWLNQIPNEASKQAGIALGAASAAAIIVERADDGMLVPGSYEPQNPLEIGDYRFVPPLDFIYRPAFGESTPFGIPWRAKSFRPGPPPRLTSEVYAHSVNEVKDFGRLASTVRSPDQTDFAAWWLEWNEIQWGRIMRQLVETRNLGLHEAVRMFALVNMANMDATVVVWSAKQRYDFWRPFHAVRLADTDDNARTIADPDWLPEHPTPPIQEYPSAHTIQCYAIAEVLKWTLRTDSVEFATQSTTALASNPVRSFTRLSSAAEECGESRIMAGYHYRFSVIVGAAMGRKVGRYIAFHRLRRD
jgi:hypothetical protein